MAEFGDVMAEFHKLPMPGKLAVGGAVVAVAAIAYARYRSQASQGGSVPTLTLASGDTGGTTTSNAPTDGNGSGTTPVPTPVPVIHQCPPGYHWDAGLNACVPEGPAPIRTGGGGGTGGNPIKVHPGPIIGNGPGSPLKQVTGTGTNQSTPAHAAQTALHTSIVNSPHLALSAQVADNPVAMRPVAGQVVKPRTAPFSLATMVGAQAARFKKANTSGL